MKPLGLFFCLIFLAAPLWAQEKPTEEKVPDLLTPQTDQTNDWRVRKIFTGQTITFYGQISQALLGYDDGVSRRTYAPVDNSNKSTRVGLLWQLYPVFGLDAVARLEAGITPRASNAISQTDSSGDGFNFDGTNWRKLELIIDNLFFGTISLGQGSMATDGIAEIDLSNTDVAAYSAVSQPAGGQFIRFSNGELSPVVIGDVFDNYDGDNVTGYNSDGSRKVRVRVDTPEYKGLTFSIAGGKDLIEEEKEENIDIALRYDGRFEEIRVSAGAGYSWKKNDEVVSGSFSILHHETGANLTVAMGKSTAEGRYKYVKLGVLRSVFPIGKTAVSLDIFSGDDLFGPASSSRSVGLALAQQVKKYNLEIFALLRRYRYDDRLFDYKSSTAFLSGLRWQF